MHEQPSPPLPPQTVVEWRLGAVEKRIEELVTRSEGWHSSLGSQITGLSNQIGTTLAALPGLYSPRPEAEERHRAIGERFEDVERRFGDHGHEAIDARFAAMDERTRSNLARIERIELLGWGFVAGLVATLGTALFALMRVQQAGGGP